MFKKSSFLLFIFLYLFSGKLLAQDPASEQPALSSITSSMESTEEKKNIGEIVFFPYAESRPSGDRHHVQTGQEIEVCLKISSEAPAFLIALKQSAVGFRLIMEDNQDPPNVLTLVWGDWLKWLKEDTQGCLIGKVTIPQTTKSGVYQVADLLIVNNHHDYYSLRDYLFDFGQVDEFEIQNPKNDLTPPTLLQLISKDSVSAQLKFSGGVLRAKIQQTFVFQDDISGLLVKSLRVFYKLTLDGQDQGLKEAYCKFKKKNNQFYCSLKLSEPYFEWSLRQVVLELDSIYLKDLAGNQLVLNDPALFTQKAQGTPTRFEFYRENKWHSYSPQELSKDELF